MSGTLEKLIQNLYSLDKDIVNNDTKLTCKVYRLLGWDDEARLERNLENMPRQDEITRARRKLHQEGLIEYAKDVEEKRFKLYKEKTEEYSSIRHFQGLTEADGKLKPAIVEVDEETNTVRIL